MRAAVLGMMLLCGIAQGAEPKTVTNTIGMKLIQIPAGTFTMGSRSDEQGHSSDEGQVKVTLTKPFRLGKTEVTQGQWKKVMGTEPWATEGLDKLRKVRDVRADKDCPATYVSWADARQFCDKLTELERKIGKLTDSEEYRLPTEAEWEYACRAGTETAYSFADDAKQLGDYGWFEAHPHKVGTKKPNPWGLHDMHGNVSEWCSDWHSGELRGGTDPVGPEFGPGHPSRVYRGGGSPGRNRSAARGSNVPSSSGDYLGFRVARSQSETGVERRQQGAEPAPQVAAAELIEIPAGKFTMGSPADEKKRGNNEEQVAVSLTKPLRLGKTEVTQGQWQAVMGTEPWKGMKFVQADKDCPATCVSFFDAVEFCEKLTDLEHKSGKLQANEEYRLPTEAEWEYACRAGTTTAFSFGDESKLNSHA